MPANLTAYITPDALGAPIVHIYSNGQLHGTFPQALFHSQIQVCGNVVKIVGFSMPERGTFYGICWEFDDNGNFTRTFQENY